jgi:hypothetical protein
MSVIARVIAGRSQTGLDEQGAEFVAVQAQRSGLGVDLGAADVGGRVPGQEPLEVAVAVEAAQRRQAASDGRAHPTLLFHRPGEHLQMGAAHVEQAEPVVDAPGGEPAQIGCVAHPGVARVPGQERADRTPLANVERVFVTDKTRCGNRTDLLGDPTPAGAGTKAAQPPRPPLPGATTRAEVERHARAELHV